MEAPSKHIHLRGSPGAQENLRTTAAAVGWLNVAKLVKQLPATRTPPWNAKGVKGSLIPPRQRSKATMRDWSCTTIYSTHFPVLPSFSVRFSAQFLFCALFLHPNFPTFPSSKCPDLPDLPDAPGVPHSFTAPGALKISAKEAVTFATWTPP